MIRLFPLFLFFLVFLFASCQKSNVPAATVASQQEVKQVPKIIFVNLEITQDSLTQRVAITLLNSIVSDGKLKNRSELIAERPGDLQCIFLSASGQTLHTTVVPNPLAPTFEYASEDGKLQKKTVKLLQATFTLRAPLQPGTTQLLVQQIQDNRQLKDLQIVNLSL